MKKPAEEINQAIRNTPGKLPDGCVFQLNEQEFENWKSQIVTSNWQRKRWHQDKDKRRHRHGNATGQGQVIPCGKAVYWLPEGPRVVS